MSDSTAAPAGGAATSVICEQQTATAAPNNGSLTITATPEDTTEIIPLTLVRPPARIERTVRIAEGRLHVEWREGTVDNEGLGRKSSKKCCVFKKKRNWDESSDESDWEERHGDGGPSDHDSHDHHHHHHHNCNHGSHNHGDHNPDHGHAHGE